ncbi:MAG: hypothetical protein ACLFUB_13305 [Cyclobacteriaceae bacterium]
MSHQLYGQKQLLVIKHDEAVARFSPGQAFSYKYKGSRKKVSTYIQSLADTAIITHSDTVMLHEIEKIYFEMGSFRHTLGAALIIAGAGRFIVDQINNIAVQGNRPSLDQEVNEFSISTIAAGLPLFLIRKKSHRMGYTYRPIIVTEQSYLYRSR